MNANKCELPGTNTPAELVSEAICEICGASPLDNDSQPRLLTLRQFSEKEPAFPISRLRQLFFYSKPRRSTAGLIRGNGFANAYRKVGATVFVHVQGFYAAIDAEHKQLLKNEGGLYE